MAYTMTAWCPCTLTVLIEEVNARNFKRGKYRRRRVEKEIDLKKLEG